MRKTPIAPKACQGLASPQTGCWTRRRNSRGALGTASEKLRFLRHLMMQPCPQRRLHISAELPAAFRLQPARAAITVHVRAARPVQQRRVASPEGEDEPVGMRIAPPCIARVILELRGLCGRISRFGHRCRSRVERGLTPRGSGVRAGAQDFRPACCSWTPVRRSVSTEAVAGGMATAYPKRDVTPQSGGRSPCNCQKPSSATRRRNSASAIIPCGVPENISALKPSVSVRPS